MDSEDGTPPDARIAPTDALARSFTRLP
jgi:hypothetical protein